MDRKNETNFLTQIEFEAKNKANEFLSKGIGNENLNQQRQTIVSNPPTLNLSSELYAIVPEARISSMVAEIIAENLIANQKLEEELWNEQKEKASESIENVTVQFFKDEVIVNEGDPINEVTFQALNDIKVTGTKTALDGQQVPIFLITSNEIGKRLRIPKLTDKIAIKEKYIDRPNFAKSLAVCPIPIGPTKLSKATPPVINE